MSRLPDIFAPKPVPKPISAARWLPLAKKHGLVIDFETKCVGTLTITEFFGSDWCAPDVGACVIKVAEMIDAANDAETLKKTGEKS